MNQVHITIDHRQASHQRVVRIPSCARASPREIGCLDYGHATFLSRRDAVTCARARGHDGHIRPAPRYLASKTIGTQVSPGSDYVVVEVDDLHACTSSCR